jgi:hypothetical protein
MSISTYFRPNIHQNGPEILGVNTSKRSIRWSGYVMKRKMELLTNFEWI